LRALFKNKINFPGSSVSLSIGYVRKGYWFGATVVDSLKFSNPQPEKCNTKTGVTKLYSTFAGLQFEKDEKNKFSCIGSSIVIYNPGLSDV
jgi:hypothetical protein